MEDNEVRGKGEENDVEDKKIKGRENEIEEEGEKEVAKGIDRKWKRYLIQNT